MHLSGGGGGPWLQPKVVEPFSKPQFMHLSFLAVDFGFNYFYYSGHCAHRVANLCKSAANAPFKGWGDTLVATQK